MITLCGRKLTKVKFAAIESEVNQFLTSFTLYSDGIFTSLNDTLNRRSCSGVHTDPNNLKEGRTKISESAF